MSADGGDKRTDVRGAAGRAPGGAPPVLNAIPGGEPQPPTAEPKKRNTRRIAIMASVPVLLVLIGGYFYLTGGRTASTDNAYVEQDRVTITSDVSGRIVEVAAGENQEVKAGDLLLRIDPQPYAIALRQAEATVAAARLSVEEMRSTYQQASAQLKTASDALDYQQSTFQRQKDLLAKGVASQASYDTAEQNFHAAAQAVAEAQERQTGAAAALGGNPNIATDDHPAVMQALAALDQAKLNLGRTTVTAPAAGVVSQTSRLHIGQYVTNPSSNPTALLSLVETGNSWVEANFKETDLTKMVPGQKATVSIDAYPGHKFDCLVASIGAGTGAEFSLLPAQNATGNWVKVVQRIPVRISCADWNSQLPMRSGLSASVSVDLTSTPTKTAAN